MGTMLHNESRRLYSWWWDSHISPKNSKWLQENLTDMDTKVKSMIKLIEEDADSFARRAEMYYKKRPELMKLVEEFYRAYRALAERYDHATVELRHAHRTLTQAFPDQLPFAMGEESQSCSSGPDAEPHTPETSRPVRALLDPDELHKDAMGVSSTNLLAVNGNAANSDVSDSAMTKRGLKQLTEMFSSEGRGQNFEDGESEITSRDQSLKSQVVFESERAVKAETEIQSLKKTLAKVQAEKDTLLFQYQQNAEKLKNAERDLSHAQQDVGRLDERASKAEIEIKIFKEALLELEAERHAGLLRINDCLEKILSLEDRLSQSQEEGKGQRERAVKAETESQNLKKEFSRLEAEKEAGLARYKKCLERISDLESRIALAEENSRSLGEQIKRSEAEVEVLKKALAEMTEEKEAAALQYKQCMEIIAMMEAEISRAQVNAERLNSEILTGAVKLKSVEDQCAVLESSNQTLQSEADDLLQKICRKDQELYEKNDELKKFQSLVLEENLKFQQVAATLQALQKLHSQSQEDQRALASELKDGLRMLRDVEMCKHGMEEELKRVTDENKSLSELNISSTMSLNSLQDEILSLKEMKEKLEHEVARKEDQSDALQQEVGKLKGEINGLKNSYFLIIKQVDSVGLSPECLESAVKDLRDENAKLKEVCKRESDEKEILYEKVKDMSTLSNENSILKNFMSGLNVELEDLREKVKKLQESCHFLEGEKSSLVADKAALLSQLQMITENMQKLFEKNTLLESSLGSANSELEQLRLRSKSLEEMCQTLNNEKSNLLSERNSLVSQLESVEKRLGKLEIRFTNLEEKYSDLEKEKESTAHQVEELRGSLLVEKQERSSYVQSTESRLSGLQNDVRFLQEETRLGKKEFEEELDRAVNAQIEIFILQKFVEDLEEKNFSLLDECQKHIDTKKFSDKLISELESENLEQQVEAEFLVNEIEKLRLGIHLVFRALQVDRGHGHEKKLEPEQVSVRTILENVEDLKSSLSRSEEEEQKLLVENSVLLSLLGQIRDDGAGLESEKENLKQEFEVMKGHYHVLQKEKQELLDMNEDLRLEVSKREHREEVLKTELEALHAKMVNLQGSYVSLKEQNLKVLEENRSLLKKLLDLGEEKNFLVEENDVIIHEVVALSTLSLVLETFAAEKAMELSALTENLNTLNKANNDLKVETRILREKMAKKEVENFCLKESLEGLKKEVREVRELNDQTSLQVLLEKDFLRVKSTELSEADEKMKATESLNGKLCATVEELKMECEELKWNRENLEQKILELTEENSNQKKEVESLNEVNNNLETRVGMLCKEIEEHRIREENLSSELQEKSNEFELWEAEASGFYFDLQISAVREVLLENKVHELIEVCESLEGQSTAKTAEIEQTQNKVSFLESHIRKLETKLSAYVPVVASLKENVASLEHNARLKAKLLEASNRVQKIHRREMCVEELREYQAAEIPDGIVDLRKMQSSIKAVEKAMVEEMEKLAVESVETMEEEVERLAVQETAGAKPEIEKNDKIIAVNLMKDIQLDQVSGSSLYGRSRSRSRRKTGRPEDQMMLKLWETAEENRASTDSHAGPVDEADTTPDQASGLTSDIIEQPRSRSRRPSEKSLSSSSSFRLSSSSELRLEKELGVDELKRSGGGHKVRILERLASDANKLSNLQRSVQDLKKKIDALNNSDNDTKRRGKKDASYYDDSAAAAEEFETVQRHLLEVEEAIVELVEVNDRLTKDVEESRPSSSEGKSVTERARKGAEKIGQLQFEVQNIQYILLKLDGGENDEGAKKKGKANRFAGVLLRDFIYSSRRRRQKRKKSCLCGCTRPKASED